MFGELPKIFDRDFIIGYFLPVVIFWTASLLIRKAFGIFPELLPGTQTDLLLYVGLASLIVAASLLAANRSVYRLLEGYGQFNPARLFLWNERRRYRQVQAMIRNLDEKYRGCIDNKQEFPLELQTKRNELMQRVAERFPDQASLILPTAFGNTIRAFECYPRVMYGFDLIPGWAHLQVVIPQEYRGMIGAAKAQTDFWVNLWILSLIFTLEYIIITFYSSQIQLFWVPLVALVLAFVSSSRAKSAAVEWGDVVRASVDIFLPELLKKMDFGPPVNKEEEQQLWRNFSQAIIDCCIKN